MRDYEAIKETCRQLAERRAFICEHFPKNGVGAEIGVLYGQFSEVILRVAKPKMLYLVDPWENDDKYGDRTKEQMEEMYKEVKLKYNIFIQFDNFKGEVQICRQESRIFFDQYLQREEKLYKKGFQPIFLDFVYIDGSHEYQDVLSDLRGAWEIVSPGGIIAGDDYEYTRHWKDNVQRAVNDFCQEKGIEHEVYEHGQFLIRR